MAWIMDSYEYNVRICQALPYPPQALLSTYSRSIVFRVKQWYRRTRYTIDALTHRWSLAG